LRNISKDSGLRLVEWLIVIAAIFLIIAMLLSFGYVLFFGISLISFAVSIVSILFLVMVLSIFTNHRSVLLKYHDRAEDIKKIKGLKKFKNKSYPYMERLDLSSSNENRLLSSEYISFATGRKNNFQCNAEKIILKNERRNRHTKRRYDFWQKMSRNIISFKTMFRRR
jgi:hypothetical protein